MAFIPGADGNKSVFGDGIQTDHISENSSGHGSRVRGISDPTTYPVIAGDVGEMVTWSTPPVDSVSTFTTSYSDWTNASITLSKGRWLIQAQIQTLFETSTTVADRGYAIVAITDASNNIVDDGKNYMERSLNARCQTTGQLGSVMGCLAFSIVKDVTAESTVYKIRGRKIDTTGTGWAGCYNSANYRSTFFAVRIA